MAFLCPFGKLNSEISFVEWCFLCISHGICALYCTVDNLIIYNLILNIPLALQGYAFPLHSTRTQILYMSTASLYKPGSSSSSAAGVTEFEILKASHKSVCCEVRYLLPFHDIGLGLSDSYAKMKATRNHKHGRTSSRRSIMTASSESSPSAI